MSQGFATSLLGVGSEGRALYREVELVKLGRENMGGEFPIEPLPLIGILGEARNSSGNSK